MLLTIPFYQILFTSAFIKAIAIKLSAFWIYSIFASINFFQGHYSCSDFFLLLERFSTPHSLLLESKWSHLLKRSIECKVDHTKVRFIAGAIVPWMCMVTMRLSLTITQLFIKDWGLIFLWSHSVLSMGHTFRSRRFPDFQAAENGLLKAN